MNEVTVGVWAVTGLLGEVAYTCGELDREREPLPGATLVATVHVESWDDARPVWGLLAHDPAPASPRDA